MLDYVSDKIPTGVLNPKDKWHGVSHITNVVNRHPGVFNAYIPLQYEKKMCFTMGAPGHESTTNKRGIPACGGCYRTFPWFGYYCFRCGGFFIRDFGDPRFCDLYPTCWGCLPELPWSHCPDHGNLYSRRNPLGGEPWAPFEPTGINPRKFTEEEIADAFAFLND